MTRRKLNAHTLALWAALPMARTAQVESRLKMILKPGQNRRTLTRHAVVGSLVAAALGVGTLAVLRPEARAQTVTQAAAPTLWTQTLPGGATVELVGVADVPPYQEGRWQKDNPPPRRGWWQPDGAPLAHASVDSNKQMIPVGTRNMEAWRQFAVRVSPPVGAAASSLGTTFDLSQTNGLTNSSWQQASRGGRDLLDVWLVGASFSDWQKPPVIRCGVASGPWVTLSARSAQEGFDITSTAPYMFQSGQDTLSHDDHGQVVFSPASLVGGATAITVTHDLPSDRAQTRIVAVDLKGKVFTDGGEPYSIGVGNTSQATYVFKGLPLRRVREFQFQVRPYEWVEFKGIALTPDRK